MKTIRMLALICSAFFALGLLLAVLFWLPYDQAKSIVDLFAKDGNLESLTPERFASLGILRYAGLLIMAIAIAAWSWRGRVSGWMQRFGRWVIHQGRSLGQDSRDFVAGLRIVPEDRLSWMIVAAWMVLAAVNKSSYLWRAVNHDEAYTFIAFASRGLPVILSDYHLPNNHIFHSLLQFVSFQVFGNAPWAIRLPAFIAGVLLVPAAYLTGKALFNKPAGLFFAGMMATLEIVHMYTFRARGYGLIILLTVLLIYLAHRLIHEKNRLLWILFVLTGALGFYTIPVFLYPFGMVCVWLGLAWISRETQPTYGKSFLKYFLPAGISAGVLTMLLYTPVILYSGANMLFANRFVTSLGWADFSGNVLARLQIAWTEWQTGLPDWLMHLSLAVFILAIAFHKSASGHWVPIPAALAVWMGLTLLVQQVAPEPRVWSYAIPVYFLYACGGFTFILERIASQRPNLRQSTALIATLGLTALAGWNIWHTVVAYSEQGIEDVPAAVLYLQDTIGENDVYFSNVSESPVVWYYSMINGVPDKHFQSVGEFGFDAAYVIDPVKYQESLEHIVDSNSALETVLDFDSAELVHTIGSVEIYRLVKK